MHRSLHFRSRSATLLVALATAVSALLSGCSRREPWNVLLVTFDTTRADHLGPYGDRDVRTPTLDALAAEGVLFEEATSAVPITMPSHTTILTGEYPLGHGVRDNGNFVLSPEVTTLPEVLRARGWHTAAAVGGFPLVARFGLNQGFELYDDRLRRKDDDYLGRSGRGPSLYFEERRAGRVAEALLPWLRREEHRPFFAWMHFYDPHQPFDPPPPYDQLFAADPYSGEISYADEVLGDVLGELRRLGLWERTVVVFTADHGEGRGQHREMTHSYLVYQTTQHVPLILRIPGGPAGLRVSERVSSVDIAPTILDLLGVEVPASMQGTSLVGLFDDSRPEPRARPFYAETLSPWLSQGWGEQRALFEDGWKYIHGPRPELYHLDEDPQELHDLAAADPERATAMRETLAAFVERHATASSVASPVDEDTRAQLQALGYLSANGAETEIDETLRDEGIPPQDRIETLNANSTVRSLLTKGQALPALEEIEKLLRDDPDNRFYLENAARAEAMLGRYDAALARLDHLERLAPLGPTGARLLCEVGSARYAAGERVEGIDAVRRGVALAPSAPTSYLLALMLAEQGMPGSDALLAQALEEDPTFAPARLEIAVRLDREGRSEEAEEQFQRAVRDRPYDPRAQYNYATYLLHDGRLEEAAERFERAIELGETYPEAYYGAVVARVALEQPGAARDLLGRFEIATPESPLVDQARAVLEGR
ncbi:MAG: sulfatase-like hydrolase/transferase [Thermoanaerobaculia bacterium]